MNYETLVIQDNPTRNEAIRRDKEAAVKIL
jgi:hypothetical protein